MNTFFLPPPLFPVYFQIVYCVYISDWGLTCCNDLQVNNDLQVESSLGLHQSHSVQWLKIIFMF